MGFNIKKIKEIAVPRSEKAIQSARERKLKRLIKKEVFMNADFVSFSLAKKLKEKGFNETCYNYYEPLKHCLNQIKTPWTNKEGESYGVITAPTISQVLKWLREEKKIHISITMYEYTWGYTIYDLDTFFPEEYSSYYNTYEAAVLAGIEYCLDNLI